MDSPLIATIMMWAPSWAPKGWALCEGQLLQIGQYQALYSLIGVTYGGNATQNFALPDLRSRMPMGAGTGPGLTPRQISQKAGAESATLGMANLPPHAHSGDSLAFHATSATATSQTPTGQSRIGAAVVPEGLQSSPANIYAPAGSGDVTLAPGSISGQTSIVGAGAPISTLSPFLVLNFCIALDGIYPSRP